MALPSGSVSLHAPGTTTGCTIAAYSEHVRSGRPDVCSRPEAAANFARHLIAPGRTQHSAPTSMGAQVRLISRCSEHIAKARPLRCGCSRASFADMEHLPALTDSRAPPLPGMPSRSMPARAASNAASRAMSPSDRHGAARFAPSGCQEGTRSFWCTRSRVRASALLGLRGDRSD